MDLTQLRFARGTPPHHDGAAGVRVEAGVTVVTAARLRGFDGAGALGVVTDTRFVRCHWPALDRPTMLFAEGSSGIAIEGPPTPRNVMAPAGTVFLARVPADGGAPIPTRGDCVFLRHRESLGARTTMQHVGGRRLPVTKEEFDDYVAELTIDEALDLVAGRVAEGELRQAKAAAFTHVSDGRRLADVLLAKAAG